VPWGMPLECEARRKRGAFHYWDPMATAKKTMNKGAAKTALPTKAAKRTSPATQAAAKPYAPAKGDCPFEADKDLRSTSRAWWPTWRKMAAVDVRAAKAVIGVVGGDHPRFGSQEGLGLVHAAGPAEG